MFWQDVLQLITTPPGGLVYHLITLFAIQAALGMALSQRREAPQEAMPRRIAVAMTVILATRLLLVFVALLARAGFLWQGMPAAVSLAPPLERLFDLWALALIIWAFVLSAFEAPWPAPLFLGGNLLFSAAFGLVGLILWGQDLRVSPELVYSLSWQEIAWRLWELVLVLLAGLLLFRAPVRQRRFLGGLFTVLLLGRAGQLILPDPTSHIAGWVRLSNLVAYPLLAVIVYRQVVQELSYRARELQDVSRESLSQVAGLLFFLEASQRTVASLDLPAVLENAALGMAQVLKADLCALALLEENQRDRLRLMALYSGRSKQPVVEVFPLETYQVVRHSLTRRRQVMLNSETNQAQVQAIYSLLGETGVGPLLVQPLLRDRSPLGVILVGNPRSGRPFTDNDGRLAQALAHQITIAIENARRYRRMELRAEQLSQDLQTQQARARRERAELEDELQRAKEDVELFTRRISELEDELKRQRQLVRDLTARLHREEAQAESWESLLEMEKRKTAQLTRQLQEREAALQEAQAELEEARQQAAMASPESQAELEKARQETSQLAQQLQEREAALQEVQAELEKARQEMTQLTQQLQEREAALQEAQAELEEARQEVAQLAQQLQEKEAAQLEAPVEQLEQMEKEREALRSELEQARQEIARLTERLQTQESEAAAAQASLEEELSAARATLVTLDQQLRQMEEQRAKEEFIASLAQELRTPMTSIMGYTDLLLGESVGILGDMQRRFLQRVKANIERMWSMLYDLIGITAIDTGQLRIQRQLVDVAQVIEDALMGARAQLEERELNLELELADELPPVSADPDALRQIITNLLSNACKCSPAGSTLRLTATVTKEDLAAEMPHLLIAVTDAGGGIAPEDRDRVFERFYRAEKPLIAGLGETGVGLAIVKALVEAHGGRVWVESEMGKGSTFYVALPLQPPSASQEVEAHE